ncbi:MAG: CDP-alcohol phosphatidyltransferase family protein [Alphaproteobacteria bacterium]|nr:CDP-alcohol phosphatidyltransferase family protein [Alphaproteobacteria bacterium]MBQ8042295.1 CDP-alcohol phosphatidyltransferase family protein [Alphaproteobacteria bacterium]MBQ8367668.1 CDP-alcohol phosphatidyltransferase family protein [Alphaproteobacteria bacterium]MBQ8729336.1 CDP-alcohol phosphatidyltransferase family protein [Alphaproteobacteria bacterium]
MKFFVNFLSAFRIAAAFAIIPTLMFELYWTTFILYVLAAMSDWFDGYLARKYNVCTKIGGVMDHIGDKLLVVNTLIMLTVMMPVWFIVVPVILMVARELYISGLREFLGTQKIEMPVPKARFSMGKIKTTLQMISIAAFLLIFVISTMITPNTDSRTLMYLIYTLPYIGIWGLWLSLVASLWSATQYTQTFLGHMKKIK